MTSLCKRFLSFDLEARSLALSLDRERPRMRSFNSCWLNRFGFEAFCSLGHTECLQSAEWLQVKYHLRSHSFEALELINCHNEGLTSLRSSGFGSHV
jgi:hypothetical protein